jgi:integrase
LGETVGEIVEAHWLSSRCKPDDSKGGIYKVYMSIPPELRDHYGKRELKKSTRTRDPKAAKRIQHEITANWINEFRAILGRDNYAKLIDALALDNVHYAERFIEENPYVITFTSRPESLEEAQEAIKTIRIIVRELRTAVETHDGNYFVKSGILKREIKRGFKISLDEVLELQKLVEYDLDEQFSITASSNSGNKKSKIRNAPNKSLYPRPSEFIDAYFKSRKWSNKAAKEKKTSQTRIEDCLRIIGDPPLDQIIARHGHEIAEHLEELGKANNTIKGYLSSLSGLLDYIRLYELDTESYPNKPWITSNPTIGLPLSNYGTPKKSYEALSEEQLYELFSQEITPKDRLCLELLITTGCRLDEIALLTWGQIKVDKNNIRYIDLASEALVKNDNSKRLVPIPEIITLPERSIGRMFDYAIDPNGKASRAAGKRLLNKYIHPIRYGTSDNRKTVHSLRHNFIGFLDWTCPEIVPLL